MSEQHERLRRARKESGFATGAAAAEAMGVKIASYMHHENGTAGLSRAGQRYARFFKVDYEWLMTGRGAMRGEPHGQGLRIAVDGLVGAGALVELVDDASGEAPHGYVTFPDDGTLGALLVRGDSQWPRFLDGETVLYDRRAVTPGELVGRTAIVQTLDGARLIKILRPGARVGSWRLESHNAPPIDNVELMGAWRYVGVVAIDGAEAPALRLKRR